MLSPQICENKNSERQSILRRLLSNETLMEDMKSIVCKTQKNQQKLNYFASPTKCLSVDIRRNHLQNYQIKFQKLKMFETVANGRNQAGNF